jgi:hypothetical protein
MMKRDCRVNPFVGALVAGSLLVSSTGAVAATAKSIPHVNPWAALTAMSGGAPAAALCGGAAAVAAAAATQAPPAGCVLPQVDQPPPVATSAPPTPVPVPPIEPAGAAFGFDPLLLGLGALAIGALVYFVVKNKNNNNDESPS